MKKRLIMLSEQVDLISSLAKWISPKYLKTKFFSIFVCSVNKVIVGFSRCFHLGILTLCQNSCTHLQFFISPISCPLSLPRPFVSTFSYRSRGKNHIRLGAWTGFVDPNCLAHLSWPFLTPSTFPKGGLKPYQPSSFSFLPSALLYLSQRSLDPWVEWVGHDSGQLSAKPPALWCSVCLCICLCAGLQFIRPLIHPSIAGLLYLCSPWLLAGVGQGFMTGGCQSEEGGVMRKPSRAFRIICWVSPSRCPWAMQNLQSHAPKHTSTL